MKLTHHLTMLSAAAVVLTGTLASAAITDVDSALIEERVWNDFPDRLGADLS